MTQVATMQNVHPEAKRPSVEGRGGSSVLNTIERGQGADIAPDRILEIAYAFWKAKVLLSAVELDLFTVLADGALDLNSLAVRLGVHKRAAADFFDSLVALNLLGRDR